MVFFLRNRMIKHYIAQQEREHSVRHNKRMERIVATQEPMEENNSLSSKAQQTVEQTPNKPSIRTSHAAGTLCPTHQNSETTVEYK